MNSYGLSSHPQYKIAKRLMKLPDGGSYTVWVHNATTTHGQMTPEERKKAGIADNLIRYSTGLEGVSDAIAALKKALNKL